MVVVDLGSIIRVLEGWKVCIDTCSDECVVCMDFNSVDLELSEEEKKVVAMYLFARMTRRYQVVGAMYLYSLKNKVFVAPEKLIKALNNSDKIIKKLAITPYNIPWETVFWRGLCYSQVFIELEKPVVIKIVPPKDKVKRERLRVLLEGKRVTIRGKTYRVGGLLKKAGAGKLAPWVYYVLRKNLPVIMSNDVIRECSIEHIDDRIRIVDCSGL